MLVVLVARAFLVSKYPSVFGLSTGRVWNAARNILKQKTTKDMLSYSSCFILKFHVPTEFYDGEVRSYLSFLKSAETVLFLVAGTVTFKRFIKS